MRYIAKGWNAIESLTTNGEKIPHLGSKETWMVVIGYLLPANLFWNPAERGWVWDKNGDSTIIVHLRSPYLTEESAIRNARIASNTRVIAGWAKDGFTGQFRPLTEEELRGFQNHSKARFQNPEEYWQHIDFDYEGLFKMGVVESQTY